MVDIHVQRTSRIEESLGRLVELARDEQRLAGLNAVGRIFIASMEDRLYELTGQLLELFRLEDEHHSGKGIEFERLLIVRRKLSEELHRLLESVVSARSCRNRTAGELLRDVEAMSEHFRIYRAMSLNLNSAFAPR